MSKQSIFNHFINQAADLRKYMKSYSFTLRNYMSEEDFSELYNTLCEIDSKYETYAD